MPTCRKITVTPAELQRWRHVLEPAGYVRTEAFPSATEAHARWVELRRRFTLDGWLGRCGRE